MNRSFKTAVAISAITLALGSAHAQTATQGISKGEILIGTILDISGPIAAF